METEKRYVKRDDPDNVFTQDKGEWVHCEHCGRPIIVPPGSPKFCNMRDGSGCPPDEE